MKTIHKPSSTSWITMRKSHSTEGVNYFFVSDSRSISQPGLKAVQKITNMAEQNSVDHKLMMIQ